MINSMSFTGNSKKSRQAHEKSSKKSHHTQSSNTSRHNSRNYRNQPSQSSSSESDESEMMANKPIKRGIGEIVVQENGTDSFLMSKESYKLL